MTQNILKSCAVSTERYTQLQAWWRAGGSIVHYLRKVTASACLDDELHSLSEVRL